MFFFLARIMEKEMKLKNVSTNCNDFSLETYLNSRNSFFGLHHSGRFGWLSFTN